MAERVQVQGLGDAVPGIQPTIQRAGQYSVGQRRASAVGRNKLMDHPSKKAGSRGACRP